MANHKSAEKRIRRNAVRAKTNHARVSRIRTFIKKVEAAITSGDQSSAREAFQVAMPEMHRGVTRGVFHKKTIARKLSRLSARIKALGV